LNKSIGLVLSEENIFKLKPWFFCKIKTKLCFISVEHFTCIISTNQKIILTCRFRAKDVKSFSHSEARIDHGGHVILPDQEEIIYFCRGPNKHHSCRNGDQNGWTPSTCKSSHDPMSEEG
jgi:hypothetical protein